MSHPRYYRIANITIQVESDLPITDATFSDTLELFRVDGPGVDTVTIQHHFKLPDLQGLNLGKQVYRKPPWAIYQQRDAWVYLGIAPEASDPTLWKVATFNHDHTHAHIYNDGHEDYLEGGLTSLTMFPSDQILVARLLADRNGCYLHSAGAILNGAGLLFVGHSEAGKSTLTRMLMDAGVGAHSRAPFQIEILCDDRNIVRRLEDGWHVYGTWSHGDIPDVSPSSALLKAICFLEKAGENTLMPLTDRKEIIHRLLACLIKPMVTAEWWQKEMNLLDHIVKEVPCYTMHFDKSEAIVEELVTLTTK